jgi:hypothetical protein
MFLEELAKNKKIEVVEIKKKMANCGSPGFTGGGSGVCIRFLYLTLLNFIRHYCFFSYIIYFFLVRLFNP